MTCPHRLVPFKEYTNYLWCTKLVYTSLIPFSCCFFFLLFQILCLSHSFKLSIFWQFLASYSFVLYFFCQFLASYSFVLYFFCQPKTFSGTNGPVVCHIMQPWRQRNMSWTCKTLFIHQDVNKLCTLLSRATHMFSVDKNF